MIFEVPYFLKLNGILFSINSKYEFKDEEYFLHFSFYDFNILCLHSKNNIFENVFFETFCGVKDKLVFRMEKLGESDVKLNSIIYLSPSNKGSIFFIKKIISFLRKNEINYVSNVVSKNKGRRERSLVEHVIRFNLS